MSTALKKIIEYERALIYCRVSSQRQVKEGHGLDSQELRCINRAEYLKLKVAKVFPDEGISGKLFDRPAMTELIDFLDTHPNEHFVIIFDDLKRFARDVKIHLKLKHELVSLRHARLECLNFNFEDSPIGRAVEIIIATTAQLEREQNAEQVKNKMKARLEAGYWTFDFPPGLKYIEDPVHGKLLVPDEPKATIIKNMLLGFKTGKFNTQTEMRDYLEQHNFYHRHKGTKVHLEQVKRLLTNVLFAGYIEYPKWKVSLRKGHHTGLITLEDHQVIMDKLNGKVKLYARMKERADLPLRGFILCSECRKPYTASFTRKKRVTKPLYSRGFYRCNRPHCILFNKSAEKELVEKQFGDLVRKVTPTTQALELNKAIVLDVWNKEMAQISNSTENVLSKVTQIDQSINSYLERIGKTANDEVVAVYEEKLGELKKQKTILEDSLSKKQNRVVTFETALNVVCEFIQNPIKLWESDDFEDQKLVMRMVFDASIPYKLGFGFETAKISLPFEVFSLCATSNSHLVEKIERY